MNKRKIGSNYEMIAGKYLEEMGYEILEYNYRCRFGEIDIVAKDKTNLVFVEVKYRKNNRFGTPFEAVDLRKQYKIMGVAKFFMQENRVSDDTYIRFDVVGITGNNIEIIKNAFGGI